MTGLLNDFALYVEIYWLNIIEMLSHTYTL